MCVCVYISPYIGENIKKKKKKLSFQLEKPEKELNKSTKCTKKANSNEIEARMKVKVKVKLLSCVRLFAAPWTVAHHAPPSMEFSRQEYWSGLPFPSPGKSHLLNQHLKIH